MAPEPGVEAHEAFPIALDMIVTFAGKRERECLPVTGRLREEARVMGCIWGGGGG
jgi:hypothetical protein